MVLRNRHRNWIAIARTNAFHLMCPKPERPPAAAPFLVAACTCEVQIEFGIAACFSVRFSSAFETKPPRSGQGRGGFQRTANQALRSPSAARFHCVTLSAIMRVDFIAAWLSWA